MAQSVTEQALSGTEVRCGASLRLHGVAREPVIVTAVVVTHRRALVALQNFVMDFLRSNRGHMRDLCAGPAWGTIIHVGDDQLTVSDVMDAIRGLKVHQHPDRSGTA